MTLFCQGNFLFSKSINEEGETVDQAATFAKFVIGIEIFLGLSENKAKKRGYVNKFRAWLDLFIPSSS